MTFTAAGRAAAHDRPARTDSVLDPRDRPGWMDAGACAGPRHDTAEFFPGANGRMAVVAAIAVCAGCAVSDECLAYALGWEIVDGVWGGTSGETRKRLIAEQRRAG